MSATNSKPTSIALIKEKNREIGHHWFDEDTLAFFNSIVYDEVHGGRYFVSAERYDDTTRYRREDRHGR
jgi:hypothetical protein